MRHPRPPESGVKGHYNGYRITTTEKIKSFALSAGADLVGIAPAEYDRQDEENLRAFIEEGRNADMSWLSNYALRARPDLLLPGAKSVIVIGVDYYAPDLPLPAGHGRIARYARGRDYHKVIAKILKKIATYITETAPLVSCKICVDSSPLLEKSFAVKAGLGFIGKNTTLITPQFGSYVFLGEIITTLELEYDKPAALKVPGTPGLPGTSGLPGMSRLPGTSAPFSTCGTCTRCLDACPTRALIAPGKMDARQCISYLTIENKGEIPPDLRTKIGNRIFGCDACQEACPYNKAHSKPATNKDITKAVAGPALPLKEILDIKTDEEFLHRFAGSPLMRAKRAGLQRNARVAFTNAPVSNPLQHQG